MKLRLSYAVLFDIKEREMSQFKSEFFNLMVERGFYNQCTNETGLTPIFMTVKKAENQRLAIWAQTPPATACTSGISCR